MLKNEELKQINDTITLLTAIKLYLLENNTADFIDKTGVDLIDIQHSIKDLTAIHTKGVMTHLKSAERTRIWHKEHPEKSKQYNSEYRKIHAKIYREKNKEKIKAYQHEYFQKNKERLIEYKRKHYHESQIANDYYKNYSKEYYQRKKKEDQ